MPTRTNGLNLLIFAGNAIAKIIKATDQQATDEVKNRLVEARIISISQGDMPLKEARLIKLDSEIAMLELKIDEKRRELGMDAPPFDPTNY
jgi:hypothetical protein